MQIAEFQFGEYFNPSSKQMQEQAQRYGLSDYHGVRTILTILCAEYNIQSQQTSRYFLCAALLDSPQPYPV